MQGKAFEIPKTLVWKSYQDVRRNKGAPGCDGQTIAKFDEHRDKKHFQDLEPTLLGILFSSAGTGNMHTERGWAGKNPWDSNRR